VGGDDMTLESFKAGQYESFIDSGQEARGDVCICEPYVVGRKIVNGTPDQPSSVRCWTMEEFQGPGVARNGCGFWRLLEMTACFPPNFPWYAAGRVNSDRELIGLPFIFCSTPEFSYDGHMQIQIGCQGTGDHTDKIIWPAGCDSITDLSDFA
jgi:hypothetical protein